MALPQRLVDLKAAKLAAKQRARSLDAEAFAYAAGLACAAYDEMLLVAQDPQGVIPPRLAEELAYLTLFALAFYRATFPKARGERAWIFRPPPLAEAIKVIRNRGERSRTIRSGFIVCRFCCTRLVRGSLGVDYSSIPLVRAHTVLCGLQVLQGIRKPAEPGAPMIGTTIGMTSGDAS